MFSVKDSAQEKPLEHKEYKTPSYLRSVQIQPGSGFRSILPYINWNKTRYFTCWGEWNTWKRRVWGESAERAGCGTIPTTGQPRHRHLNAVTTTLNLRQLIDMQWLKFSETQEWQPQYFYVKHNAWLHDGNISMYVLTDRFSYRHLVLNFSCALFTIINATKLLKQGRSSAQFFATKCRS